MTTQDAGARWAAWLADRVATRGVDGKMSQAKLRAQLADAGFDVTPSTVSRWLSGTRVGDPETAAAVGVVLGDRSGALMAAGYADQSLPPHRREGDTIVIADRDRLRGMTLDEILALADGPIVIIERSGTNGQ